MKQFLLIPVLLVAAMAVGPAEIPQHLNYQGRVSVQGVNFNGPGQFKFALVDGGTSFGETATATAVVENGAVIAVNVDLTGSNYVEPPTITFGGPGTGATATADMNLGVVITITVTNGGSGYTTPPAVTISPPPTQTVHSTYWSNDGTSSVGDEPAAAVSIPVTNGLYSVQLGGNGMTDFPSGPFNIFDRPLFLRVWFNDGTHGFQQLTPDQPLAAAPYAMRAVAADMADTVPTGAIQASHLGSGAVTTAAIAPGAVGSDQLSSGAVSLQNLAPGAAAEIVRAGTAGSNVVMSSDPNSATLAAAGYQKIGSQSLAAESWTTMSPATSGAPASASGKLFHTPSGLFAFANFSAAFFDETTLEWVSIQGVGNMAAASAVWTGSEIIFWGLYLELVGSPAKFNGSYGGAAFNPATRQWRAISNTGAPSVRHGHRAVWTGSQMVIFGGRRFTTSGAYGVQDLISEPGGIYTPETDSWQPLAGEAQGRMNASLIWSGSEVIVWGGFDFQRSSQILSEFTNRATGAAWNPVTGSWRTISGTGAPSARHSHSAVMTEPGGKMLILGGSGGANGAAYDVATDSWSAVSTSGFPPGAAGAAVTVANGSLYWLGGSASVSNASLPAYNYVPPTFGGAAANSLAAYHFASNTWSSLAGANAPPSTIGSGAAWTGDHVAFAAGTAGISLYHPATSSWLPVAGQAINPRHSPAAVWTGTEILYWGGANGSGDLQSGGRYNPETNLHTAITLLGAPSARAGHSAVWSGNKLLIWGGRETGGSYPVSVHGYDPVARAWTTGSAASGFSGRQGHTAVWTGTEMIVWGGANGAGGGDNVDTGGRYNPTTDSWSPISQLNAPSARSQHTAVWTGTDMIIWGGVSNTGLAGDGWSYNPANDAWTQIAGLGAPSFRAGHSATWAGGEMIIWGGYNATLTALGDGARYVPATNIWTALPALNAPEPRNAHTAVWNGRDLIVWGGQNGPAGGPWHTGGRFAPETGTWTAFAAPLDAARFDHAAFWTGTSMHVLFGRTLATDLSDIRRYTPPTAIHFYISPRP